MKSAAESESRTQTGSPDVHGWRYSSIVYDGAAVPNLTPNSSRHNQCAVADLPITRSPRVTNPANHTEPVCYTRL